MNRHYENREAAVTVHMSKERQNKLRVVSQLDGFGGECGPYVDSLIETALVNAEIRFQLMRSAFGNEGNTTGGRDA